MFDGLKQLDLNEGLTIDGKFHYISRRRQNKRAWIKLEDNCSD